MIQLRDLLTDGGTAIVIHNLGQEMEVSQIRTSLSDCDYRISFPNEINRKIFMSSFRFAANDYQMARSTENLAMEMDVLGSGPIFDSTQKSEPWWDDYHSKMQAVCAEQLFGENPQWRIWSITLNSLGVLLEYHNKRETTKIGRVFVSSSTLSFTIDIIPHKAGLPEYQIKYANACSQSGKSSTMRVTIGCQNEILKEISMVDYVPITESFKQFNPKVLF